MNTITTLHNSANRFNTDDTGVRWICQMMKMDAINRIKPLSYELKVFNRKTFKHNPFWRNIMFQATHTVNGKLNSILISTEHRDIAMAIAGTVLNLEPTEDGLNHADASFDEVECEELTSEQAAHLKSHSWCQDTGDWQYCK